MFSYVGSDHFWGFKILNFNIFGGSQKNDFFFFWGGGMMKLWIILGVHHKSGLILGVISIHVRNFS